jgi:hypothetical protein
MISIKKISPIYQELLLKWALFLALTGWALTATFFALHQKPERYLITLNEGVPTLVGSDQEKLLIQQKWKFVKRFFFLYYNYDAGNFDERVGEASNFIAHSLLPKEMPKVVEVRKLVLEDSTFNQKIQKFQRIMEVTPGRFEAQFELYTRQGFKEKITPLKVTLEITHHEETDRNPWAFEVTGISEEVISKSG